MSQTTVAKQMEMELTDAQFQAIFDYLFRKTKNKEYRSHFEDGIMAKKRMDASGYILLNCKFYAYAHSRAKLVGAALPRPEDFNLDLEDAARLRLLDLSHIPTEYAALTIDEFAKRLEVLPSSKMSQYMGKFTTKKLRFLLKSYSEDRDDIYQRFHLAALYALYRAYPFFKDEIHFVNSAKNAIHDSGQSMIKEMTSKSRKRLIEHSDGTYEQVLVPYDTPGLQLEANNSDTFVKDSLTALARIEPLMSKRARKFLWILSGQYDERFSTHLGRDNSELAERLQFTTYQSKVRRYFGLKPAQVEDFFSRLRKRSGWSLHA